MPSTLDEVIATTQAWHRALKRDVVPRLSSDRHAALLAALSADLVVRDDSDFNWDLCSSFLLTTSAPDPGTCASVYLWMSCVVDVFALGPPPWDAPKTLPRMFPSNEPLCPPVDALRARLRTTAFFEIDDRDLDTPIFDSKEAAKIRRKSTVWKGRRLRNCIW